MEFIVSERNRQLCVINGYKYSFQKSLKDDNQRWICCRKTCKSFLKLSSSLLLVEHIAQHNHEIDNKVLNRQTISNNLKRKAIEDISQRPSKLVHKELRKFDVATLTTSDINLIKRNVRNERAKLYPKLPTSREETHKALSDMDLRTNQEESFLILNDMENGIIGFSTASNLARLCSAESIYVDGTFKSCPKFFYQIFTLHAFINHRTVPLVFCLLSGKEKKHYQLMFEGIKMKCSTWNLQLEPKEVFADFEYSIHSAAEEVWPTAEIRGCRFHLGQSWWRKIQSLGLTSVYKENGDKSKFLKYFFGLPFLKPEEVDDCFVEDIMSILPHDERITSFTDYILDNYISEESPFPPKVWAKFAATLHRTTNGCEAFHSKLNGLFHVSHPNIYLFVEVLKDLQCEIYVALRSNDQRRKPETLIKENFLREKMILFQNGSISRKEYMNAVSFKFLPLPS